MPTLLNGGLLAVGAIAVIVGYAIDTYCRDRTRVPLSQCTSKAQTPALRERHHEARLCPCYRPSGINVAHLDQEADQ